MSARPASLGPVASTDTGTSFGPLEVRAWSTLDGPYEAGFGVYYRRPGTGNRARLPRMAGTLLHLGDAPTYAAAAARARELAEALAP